MCVPGRLTVRAPHRWPRPPPPPGGGGSGPPLLLSCSVVLHRDPPMPGAPFRPLLVALFLPALCCWDSPPASRPTQPRHPLPLPLCPSVPLQISHPNPNPNIYLNPHPNPEFQSETQSRTRASHAECPAFHPSPPLARVCARCQPHTGGNTFPHCPVWFGWVRFGWAVAPCVRIVPISRASPVREGLAEPPRATLP